MIAGSFCGKLDGCVTGPALPLAVAGACDCAVGAGVWFCPGVCRRSLADGGCEAGAGWVAGGRGSGAGAAGRGGPGAWGAAAVLVVPTAPAVPAAQSSRVPKAVPVTASPPPACRV